MTRESDSPSPIVIYKDADKAVEVCLEIAITDDRGQIPANWS